MAPTKLVNIVPLVRPKSPQRPAPYEWEPCGDVRLCPQPRKPTLEEEFEKHRRLSEPSFVSQVRSNGFNVDAHRWADNYLNQQRTPLIGSHASNSHYGGYYAPQLHVPYNVNAAHQKPMDPEYFEQNREICELLLKEFPQGPPEGLMDQFDPLTWPSLAELEALLLPGAMDFSMDQSMMSSPISEDLDLEDPGLIDPASLGELASSLEQNWHKLREQMMLQPHAS